MFIKDSFEAWLWLGVAISLLIILIVGRSLVFVVPPVHQQVVCKDDRANPYCDKTEQCCVYLK